MRKVLKEKPAIESSTYEAFMDSLTDSLEKVGIDVNRQLEVNRHLHTVDARVIGVRVTPGEFALYRNVRAILTQEAGHGGLFFSHVDEGVYIYGPKKPSPKPQYPEDWFHIDPKEPRTR